MKLFVSRIVTLVVLYYYATAIPTINGIPREVAPSAGCFKDQGESSIGSSIGPGETTIFRTKLPRTQRRKNSLTLPVNYDHGSTTAPAPLILFFHGWGGTHQECGDHCKVDAAEKGFVTVSLSGYGKPYYGSWNIAGSTSSPGPMGPVCESTAGNYCNQYKKYGCDCSMADNCWWTTCYDSVAQAMDVLDQVEQDICIDKNQIWAAGCSNGGMFTFDLASDSRSAPRIRGIIPIVGLPHYGFSSGPAFDHIAIFGMWGLSDTTVPPISNTDNPEKTLDTANKKGGWYYTAASKVMEDWTVGNGCVGSGQDPFVEGDDYGISSIDSFTYCTQGCSEREDGVRVIGCLFDGGHICYKQAVSWEPAFNFMLSFTQEVVDPSCPPADEDATFWIGKKKNNGKPVLKKCKWLKSRSLKRIENLCSKSAAFDSNLPAKDVCTGVCQTCDD